MYRIFGLHYIPQFITEQEHDQLLAAMDTEPWLNDLKRRVQHYGYRYDYRARTVDESMQIRPLPEWSLPISERIYSRWDERPDQLIVNEYLPGQGIASHIDCEPCFNGRIVSLSLGSGCAMDFRERLRKEVRTSFYLEPRSLLILGGEARYNWMHGIAARKSDVLNGRRLSRGRRVSLTFRKVILQRQGGA